ncbi:MAG: hypothetical protein QW303_00345 [Nitrososphaerota archaeon]
MEFLFLNFLQDKNKPSRIIVELNPIDEFGKLINNDLSNNKIKIKKLSVIKEFLK